ncbi:MAG: D-alanyl-D-alanine carboxypeptidase/D-alanyl-D-alanine-endopeptidase [bacterium]|nr:D-alanyl-D-alanine carboxypeptidase/D-alanyl-D-alanine-endopeptidase [bacterium]
MNNKRLSFGVLLIVIIISLGTGNARGSRINAIIKKYRNSKLLKNAGWSLSAKYVSSRRSIIAFNTRQSLAPASGLKLVTTACALHILGPGYRYKTRLYYDGSIRENGILKGNIYIVGGGDPALGSMRPRGGIAPDELMKRWIGKIKEAGIRKVDGAVIADDTLFDRIPVPGTWNWMDVGNYYGASAGALCFHDNLYRLYFKPGRKVGDEAVLLGMEPEIPGLRFVNFMKTGPRNSGDKGYIYCAPRQYLAHLRGTLPAGKPEFAIKGAIPDPPLFAAQYVTRSLKKAGIRVEKKAGTIAASIKTPRKYRKNKMITETVSVPLSEIVFITNKKSFNLYAEQLLRTVALDQQGTGSVSAGVAAIKKILSSNKINTDGLVLYDGAGLSRSNAITTRTMVDLLVVMAGKPYFKHYYRSLPIAGAPGDSGKLSRFGAGTVIARNARIKSGYLGGVKSHSGYLKDRKGRLMAFSFIVNNYSGSSSQINIVHKKLLIALAGRK